MPADERAAVVTTTSRVQPTSARWTRWADGIEALARAGLLLAIAAAIVGLPLAMAGWFVPGVAFPVAVAVAAGLWWAWARKRGDSGDRRTGRAGRAVVVGALAILSLTALNVRYTSQHLLQNRDPGVYTVTAKWVTEHGDLRIESGHPHFREAGFMEQGAGFYSGAPGDALYAQFFHALPVLMAYGGWVAGDAGMLRVPPLLGGLGLLVLLLLLARHVRHWLAVAATLAVGLGLPFVHFSRDSYSEIPTLLFLWGGLWLLDQAITSRAPAPGAVAGLVLGGAVMTRIDGLLTVIGVVGVATILAVQARTRHERPVMAAAVLAGCAATSALGWIDGAHFARPYVEDLWPDVRALLAGLGLAVVAGAIAVAACRRLEPVVRRRSELIGRVSGWIGAAITAAIVALWLGRPALGPHLRERANQARDEGLTAGLQHLEGLPVDSWRTYDEAILARLADYQGPFLVALGAVGVGLTVHLAVRRRSVRLAVLLVGGLALNLAYLWTMRISPDQIWAMRRYLPAVIPGLAFAAALAGDWLWEARGRLRPVVRALVAGSALAWLAVPAARLVPVVEARSQVPMLEAVTSACREVPADAAVLIGGRDNAALTQTIAAWCDVPTAVAPPSMERIRAVAAAFAADGRPTYFLGGPDSLDEVPPEEQAWSVDYGLLERTIESVPDALITERSERWLTRIDPR